MKRTELITTKLTLIVIGLTAGSGLLIPATYASFHPVTSDEIADGTVTGADIASNTVGLSDLANNAVQSGKIVDSGILAWDIGTNQITSQKIGDGQVFSSDIADVTIVSSDLADNAVTTNKLAGGAVKPNVQVVHGPWNSIAAYDWHSFTTDCPAGTIVTGGGFRTHFDVRVIASYPSDENTWKIEGSNTGNSDSNVKVIAVCEGASP